MSIPQARIVKHGGQLFAPPPRPSMRRPGQLKAQLRDTAAALIGMWPLTAVCLFLVAMMVFAMRWSAP